MTAILRKLFSPVLNLFETGDTNFSYKASHRTILIAVGALFYLLCSICLGAAIYTAQLAAAVPFLIFFSVGSVCLIVGFLGTDQAVAKIWGNR